MSVLNNIVGILTGVDGIYEFWMNGAVDAVRVDVEDDLQIPLDARAVAIVAEWEGEILADPECLSRCKGRVSWGNVLSAFSDVLSDVVPESLLVIGKWVSAVFVLICRDDAKSKWPLKHQSGAVASENRCRKSSLGL